MQTQIIKKKKTKMYMQKHFFFYLETKIIKEAEDNQLLRSLGIIVGEKTKFNYIVL